MTHNNSLQSHITGVQGQTHSLCSNVLYTVATEMTRLVLPLVGLSKFVRDKSFHYCTVLYIIFITAAAVRHSPQHQAVPLNFSEGQPVENLTFNTQYFNYQ